MTTPLNHSLAYEYFPYGDSDDPDHRSDLMPISLPEEADQVVRSEATLGF